MKVNAIKCPKCHDTIYSRTRHDFRHCSCGNIFVDGGLDYFRMGGDITIKSFKLKIKTTPKELFSDWNFGRDKLGLIKGVTKVDSVDKMFEEMEEDRKKRPIYHFFLGLYWRIYNLVEDIPLNVKTFIQRGKRGWANSDTWGFDYYLTKVISEGVRNLKEHIHGMPNNLTEGQWIDILNKITDTFELAHRMTKDELYLIKDKKQRAKWQKVLDDINKKHKCHDRCMTDKEIKEYEEGWKLFKEYFFNLWD